MGKVSTIGLDIAKSVFQVHGRPPHKSGIGDPKGIVRTQILLCIGRRRRGRCCFDDFRGPRKRANAANDKALEFARASLHDLNLGNPDIIAVRSFG